jgi:co-chaperonin GroES (HSP10)
MNTILGWKKLEGAIKPQGDRVLLEPIPPEHKSPGGIILDNAQRDLLSTMEWTVLAVGPGRWVTNKKTKARSFVALTELRPGDKVLCQPQETCRYLDDGTGRVIVDMKDCLARY